MKQFIISFLSLFIVLSASNTMAGQYLSQKDVNSFSAANTLKTKYGEYKVKNIRSSASSKHECRVDMVSLKKELERRLVGKEPKDETMRRVVISLKLMNSPVSHTPICSGPGQDCKVELELSIEDSSR